MFDNCICRPKALSLLLKIRDWGLSAFVCLHALLCSCQEFNFKLMSPNLRDSSIMYCVHHLQIIIKGKYCKKRENGGGKGIHNGTLIRNNPWVQFLYRTKNALMVMCRGVFTLLSIQEHRTQSKIVKTFFWKLLKIDLFASFIS